MQDLLAGLVGADEQRHERDAGRKGRHQYGGQPLERAAHHQLPSECLALEQRQIDVVADLQDAIARGDAGERDEADGALATENGWPAIHSAATLPISASGTLPMMMSARTADW